MKYLVALGCCVVLSVCAFAQATIPPGTILPVQLKSGVDSRRAKPGSSITAVLMQEVDPGSGQKLPAGSVVSGTVISVAPAQITMVFDRIRVQHRTIPITTSLRVIASAFEVNDAQLPTNTAGGDRGSSMEDWNLALIGGQVAYGRGPVMSGDRVVGRTLLSGGVLAVPEATPGTKCRGQVGTNTPQSFWIFSSSACGSYGFDQLTIAHSGRTDPLGVIVLKSPTPIHLRSGSGLLLRVLQAVSTKVPDPNVVR